MLLPEWYVSRNNERYGPYTWEDMQQMTGAGNVAKSDLVWSESLNEWKEAGTIPGLFDSHGASGGKRGASSEAGQDTAPTSQAAAGNQSKRKSRLPVFLAAGLAAVVLLAVAVLLFTDEKDEVDEKSQSPLYHEELGSLMSADQAMLYSHFGNPEQYLILFEYNPQGIERMETWTYPEMQFYYTFLNGTYIDGDTAVFPELLPDSYGGLLPVQFQAWMKPEDIASLVGEQGRDVPGEFPNQKGLYFGNGELTCFFNEQDLLIAVYRSPAAVEGGP